MKPCLLKGNSLFSSKGTFIDLVGINSFNFVITLKKKKNHFDFQKKKKKETFTTFQTLALIYFWKITWLVCFLRIASIYFCVLVLNVSELKGVLISVSSVKLDCTKLNMTALHSLLF